MGTAFGARTVLPRAVTDVAGSREGTCAVVSGELWCWHGAEASIMQ